MIVTGKIDFVIDAKSEEDLKEKLAKVAELLGHHDGFYVPSIITEGRDAKWQS